MKLTLTNVSIFIRKYGPVFILFVLAFFIIYYSVKIGIIIYEARKGPEIYYNPIFGVINKPNIKSSTSSANLNFSIDTIEGKPTTSTSSANVYLIPPPETKFGYRNRLFVMAENFGFLNPTSNYKLNEKNAEFDDEMQTLKIDITNFNFSYRYFYENDNTLFEFTQSPVTKEAINETVTFLNALGKHSPEFKNAQIKSKYYYYDKDNKTLTQVYKNLDANLIEIYFIKPNLDTLPFVSDYYPDSQNYTKLVSTVDGYKIVESQMKFFDKSIENFGVYPVMTGDEAYKLLKKGEGKVLHYSPLSKKIIIKKMYLAYFDPKEYEEYLQPVYVFEGSNDFVAFIPAIIKEYLAE
jgi:hypothetical protein